MALAAALCHRPSLLLLDETTAGIDPIGRDELWRIFTELRRDGTSVLLTTHHLDEAERCDQVGFLEDGSLLFSNSPSQLKVLADAMAGHGQLSFREALALVVSKR